MQRSFVITTIGGIAIRVHLSAIFAFVLLFGLLASVYFPGLLPNQQETTYLSVSFISALALYGSTIAHELGRAFAARRRQVAVSQITVVMFGGTSDVQRDAEKPTDELAIAAAGPGVSLVIAALAAVARFAIPIQSQPLHLFLEAVLLLNIWLGLFNLLPTLPLDGGRVLRAALWRSSGDYQAATRIASIVGRLLAAVVFAVGLLLVLGILDVGRGSNSLFGYDLRFVGAVIMTAAWFLNTGARNAYRQVELQSRFRGVNVRQLMNSEPTTVTPWTSLEELVEQNFVQRGERAVVVARDGQGLMGLVAYADVRRIARTEWGARTAGQVMTPLQDLVTVTPDDTVEVAIRRMAERHFNQLPVMDDGQFVGVITRVSILSFLDLDKERPRGRRRRER